VLNGGDQVGPHMADYLLLSKKQELPPAGILGINLEEETGECRIRSLSPGGAGVKAGLKRGDILIEISGQPVKTIADMHLALWDKKPGDRVRVNVHRKSRSGGVTARDFEIQLAAAAKLAAKIGRDGTNSLPRK
jgi:S1-C subfamily serine protease